MANIQVIEKQKDWKLEFQNKTETCLWEDGDGNYIIEDDSELGVPRMSIIFNLCEEDTRDSAEVYTSSYFYNEYKEAITSFLSKLSDNELSSETIRIHLDEKLPQPVSKTVGIFHYILGLLFNREG